MARPKPQYAIPRLAPADAFWLRPWEVAYELRCSTQTVYLLVRAKKIRIIRTRRAILISRDALRDYMEGRGRERGSVPFFPAEDGQSPAAGQPDGR